MSSALIPSKPEKDSSLRVLVTDSPWWMRQFLRGCGVGIWMTFTISVASAVFHAFGSEVFTATEFGKNFFHSVISWGQLVIPVLGCFYVFGRPYRKVHIVPTESIPAIRRVAVEQPRKSHKKSIGHLWVFTLPGINPPQND